jgi:hypothetical protein
MCVVNVTLTNPGFLPRVDRSKFYWHATVNNKSEYWMKCSSFDATRIMPVASSTNDVKSGKIYLHILVPVSFSHKHNTNYCPHMQLKGEHMRF